MVAPPITSPTSRTTSPEGCTQDALRLHGISVCAWTAHQLALFVHICSRVSDMWKPGNRLCSYKNGTREYICKRLCVGVNLFSLHRRNNYSFPYWRQYLHVSEAGMTKSVCSPASEPIVFPCEQHGSGLMAWSDCII